MAEIVFGLGSNLGNRLDYLSKTVKTITNQFGETKISPIYESEALLVPGSPPDWNRPYLNMAVMVKTDISDPIKIFSKIKQIEASLGRTPTSKQWAPREIDIDILAMENIIIDSDELNVPHKHLLSRPFALWPLADLAPYWKYSVKGDNFDKTFLQLAGSFGNFYPECKKGNSSPFKTFKTELKIK